MAYWLFKSEPDVFSIEDLSRAPRQITTWEGVRNYQARNFLRDAIRLDDLVFFYHSSCKEPGIVGLTRVVREAYPDDSAFDSSSPYFDSKSTRENPRWYCVDIKLIECFPRVLSLNEIKHDSVLSKLLVARQGNRLSITPVDDVSAMRIQKHGSQK